MDKEIVNGIRLLYFVENYYDSCYMNKNVEDFYVFMSAIFHFVKNNNTNFEVRNINTETVGYFVWQSYAMAKDIREEHNPSVPLKVLDRFTFELLLCMKEKGFNINQPLNDCGDTLLHLENNPLFRNLGAKDDVKNKTGETPKMVADKKLKFKAIETTKVSASQEESKDDVTNKAKDIRQGYDIRNEDAEVIEIRTEQLKRAGQLERFKQLDLNDNTASKRQKTEDTIDVPVNQAEDVSMHDDTAIDIQLGGQPSDLS